MSLTPSTAEALSKEDAMTGRIEVWGLAAGRGSTQGAARGAFTVCDYPNREAAKAAEGDWITVLIWRELPPVPADTGHRREPCPTPRRRQSS